MAFSLHGINVPHRKNTQKQTAVRMPAPSQITVPMSMHIGAPATPVVKVGDMVKVGTKIGEATAKVSSCIFAGASGKVTAITEYVLHNGTTVPAVVIESDGLMAVDESVTAPTVNSRQDLIDALAQSGIVGLGGAGFPTHIKLDAQNIDCLIINGAECEPYVTSDTLTMLYRGEDMAYALQTVCRFLDIKRVVFGIENNKKEAIAAVRDMAKSFTEPKVEVKVLPSVYPQGGEKVLIYHTIGRTVPVGKLPKDVGCLVLNCTTLATIGAYLKTGMPLVEKCVTVDGGAVANPQNVIVPIGTSLSDLLEFCGGLQEKPAKLINGGPMMGVAVADSASSILSNTNAILALTEREVKTPKTTACISCGACVNHCPFGLAPADIARAYDKRDRESLEELWVVNCMECGCCGFVCPANRPLVQKNKLAKQFLKEGKVQ